MSICKTKEIKALRKSTTSPSFTGLFSGTIHLIALYLHVETTVYGLSLADSQIALHYMQVACPQISAYCSQYGTNSIIIDSTVTPYTVTLASTNYTDADLQSWANALMRFC